MHTPSAPGLTPDDILQLYTRHGGLAYAGEDVSQWAHGWQCARLAQRAGASPALQLAAWLHDIGHLLTGLPGSPTVDGIDDQHERLGAHALAPLFGPDVAQPVALHVQAKRFLVTTQPDYRLALSPDSVRSLALQGGPMRAHEAAAFSALPHARDALRLRVWDDLGKDPQGLPDSPAESMRDLHRLMQRVRLRALTPCALPTPQG